MAYQPPLSERIRIQFEIFCENCTDCISSLSHNHRRPIMFLGTIALLLTMKSARVSIKKAKRGGLMSAYSTGSYGSGAGSSSLYGGGAGSSTSGSSLYGGSSGGSSLYGSGAGGAGAASSMSSGLSSYGSSAGGLGGGLRGTSTMGGASSMYGGAGGASMGASSMGGGASPYGSSSMGASSFGSSMGGMGMGASAMGGGGGGKATASLVDANPTSTVTLDPTIKMQNYGGAMEFFGQVETVQAFEAPTMVSQVLSQPGQNKVLVIDSGGSLNGAVFDAEMANTAIRNGWKGVIVNGAVRNVAQLQKLSFGVKALGTNPNKGKATMGQRGVMASMGSTQFQAGWWVYADPDGVIISQTDISGGSFGGGASSFGGSSMGSMGMGSTGGMGMGGMSGSMGMGGGYGSSGMTGGYGSSTGGSTMGSSAYSSGGSMGSSMTGGYSGGSSMGSSLTGGYGSSSSLGSSSMSGGYGSSSYGGSSYGGYGKRYSYSSRSRKKNKLFKIMLASSLAAIVWVVCLR